MVTRLGVVAATLFGSLYLFFASLIVGLVCSILGWIPPRGNLMFWGARIWSYGVMLTCGIRTKATYEGLEPGGKYVFMANHQSLFDIPVLIATLPGQVRFMAKASLFKIPFFGWGLKAGGFIPIDRRDRSRAKEAFAAAVARLEAGCSVLVFPEETRSKDGRLLPFQRGGFLLALKSGLPIVPIGIRGTREVQSAESFVIRPGRVEVRYGPPVPVAGVELRGKNALVDDVRQRVADLSGAEA